jgi:hypothetical protein
MNRADWKAAAARTEELRTSGRRGGIDREGNAVMSRTDNKGEPLPLFEGGDGRGTPDDVRSAWAFLLGGKRSGR